MNYWKLHNGTVTIKGVRYELLHKTENGQNIRKINPSCRYSIMLRRPQGTKHYLAYMDTNSYVWGLMSIPAHLQ